jgi:hypothetical protein
MALRDELEIARKDIKTDSYPISIRELASLYREGELDIHPEFQRFLRWSTEQKNHLGRVAAAWNTNPINFRFSTN